MIGTRMFIAYNLSLKSSLAYTCTYRNVPLTLSFLSSSVFFCILVRSARFSSSFAFSFSINFFLVSSVNGNLLRVGCVDIPPGSSISGTYVDVRRSFYTEEYIYCIQKGIKESLVSATLEKERVSGSS